MSSSPQSTLCAFGSGCGCGKGSSQGSPDGVCKLSSAKTTWDLLHAAAGEVERMRLKQEGYAFNHQNGNLIPQRKPSPVIPLPSKTTTSTPNPDMGGFYTQQHSLSHQRLQIAQVRKSNHTLKFFLQFFILLSCIFILLFLFFAVIVSDVETATAGKAAELGVEFTEAMWWGLLSEATTEQPNGSQ